MNHEHVILVYSPLNASRIFHLERILLAGKKILLMMPEGGGCLDLFESLVFGVVSVSTKDVSRSLMNINNYCRATNSMIAGILSLSETGMYFCAQIAEELNLPFVEKAKLVYARDKAKMRSLFKESGIPSPQSIRVTGLNEALKAADEITYPVVIKPLIAGAKLFITRIDQPSKLRAIYDEYAEGGAMVVAADPLADMTYRNEIPVLIEELMGGEVLFDTSFDVRVGEVSVEGFVCSGEIYIVAHHDKPLFSNGPFFEEIIWSTPSRIPEDYLLALDSIARCAINRLGIDNTFFHMEMRTGRDGPKVIEVAARMGGGPICRSVLESRSIDMVDILCRIACGKKVDPGMLRGRDPIPVMTFALYAPEGTLRKIEGLEKVKMNPNVVEIVQYDMIGAKIERAPKNSHCTVHAMVKATDFSTVEEIGKWIIDTITFEVDDENRTCKR